MWAERNSSSVFSCPAVMPVSVWLINLPIQTVKIKRIIDQYLLTRLPILICLCIFKTDSLTHSHREKKMETLLTFYCLGNSLKDIVIGHSCNKYLEIIDYIIIMVWELCYTSGPKEKFVKEHIYVSMPTASSRAVWEENSSTGEQNYHNDGNKEMFCIYLIFSISCHRCQTGKAHGNRCQACRLKMVRKLLII